MRWRWHEAIDFLLAGPVNPRLVEVVFALAAELLALGGLEHDPQVARERLQRQLASGAAAEHFARVVALQGGPADCWSNRGDTWRVRLARWK